MIDIEINITMSQCHVGGDTLHEMDMQNRTKRNKNNFR